MKKFSHIMNIILSLTLIAISICFLVFSGPLDDNNLITYVSGLSCAIFTFIALFYGALVPNREVYLSPKYRTVGKILYTTSTLLTKKMVSPSSVRVFEGTVPIIRFWTPVTSLMLFVLFGPLVSVNFTLNNPPLHYATVAWFIALVLIIIFKTIWQNEYYKEQNGCSGWKKIAKIYVIFFAVLLFIVIGTIVYEHINSTPSNNSIDIKKISAERKNSEEALDQLNNEDFHNNTNFENFENVLEKIHQDFIDQKTYYCVKELQDQNTSVLVWTDSSENVLIYIVAKNSNGYTLQNAFLSNQLTKQDMTGKETGVWEP